MGDDNRIHVTVTIEKPVDPYKDASAKLSLALALLVAWFIWSNANQFQWLLNPLWQLQQAFIEWAVTNFPDLWGGFWAFSFIVFPAFGVFALWVVIGVTLRVVVWQLFLKHRAKSKPNDNGV